MRLPIILSSLLLSVTSFSFAQEPQVFNSGSTGEDGVFSPTMDTIILVNQPVYNYESINIPDSVTVTFQKTADNFNVVWLSQGDVIIDGTVDVSGKDAVASAGGIGGPGGWNGGDGALTLITSPDQTQIAQPGQGPGGGLRENFADNRNGHGGGFAFIGGGSTPERRGRIYGNSFAIPLYGGSGGSGGNVDTNPFLAGGGGGGGGGALRIASSTRISVNGTILSNGGVSEDPSPNDSNGYVGGGGSGGTIKLQANFIDLGENSILNAISEAQILGSAGRIRLESFELDRAEGASIAPSPSSGPPVQFELPVDYPGLRITSIDGNDVTGSSGQPSIPDVTLTTADTVTVAVEASNIPIGTLVNILLLPSDAPSVQVDTTPLAGTFALSTASADIAFPAGVSQVIATAGFSPARQLLTSDKQVVEEVEVSIDSAGNQTTYWITESGEKVIPAQ